MRPSHPSKPSYVAKVEKIESDARGSNVKVHVQWYYRPEESIGGRRQFHGSKEVFLSDHHDVQSADTIEAKCTVHTFKSYTKLQAVGNDDFFCRFDYNSATGAFNPDRVAVYCKCEMPYNPDDLMVQCDGCTDWFHPACIEMTPEEAKQIEHFFCGNCSTEEQKLLQNSNATSRPADTKVVNTAEQKVFWTAAAFLFLSCSNQQQPQQQVTPAVLASGLQITAANGCSAAVRNEFQMGKKSEIRNANSRIEIQQSRLSTCKLQSAPFWSKFDEFKGWERDLGRSGTRFRGQFDEIRLNQERYFITYRIATRLRLGRLCTANRYARFRSWYTAIFTFPVTMVRDYVCSL
ncbi:hypothetical protein E3N88_05274 [Mikania micrantha]|uniref:PHD-type domain-containing protein n=1 Tax=Mikania micrantha TaxID=192012 RepID=A0A5N6PKI6_9ASTR|nr:hypothetical protein E3N88_05274 [Mikania micrantha]